MTQEIKFCAAPDGTRLAYAKVGQGPPLVKAANWLSHLEYDWNSPVWRPWLEALSRYHTLYRYDERGCGLSDWNVADFSLEAWVRDLETVVDAAGLDRFPLFGMSQVGMSQGGTDVPRDKIYYKVDILDVFDDVAMVRAESYTYIDYLQLVKFKETWLIANVLYTANHGHPGVPEARP